ncbi:MAG: FeoC-like transcriptional regulator [Candidatus Gracilibacteria bacterium]|nr:FeoC-like transcriptional regulator [Candidatus Gracilibacteria bacterium]
MKEQIFQYIQQKGQATIKELAEVFSIQYRMIQYHLANLVTQGKIQKVGKVPKVFYVPSPSKILTDEGIECPKEALPIIESEFLFISSIGERTYGWTGFQMWCNDRGYDSVKKAGEYKELWQSYEQERIDGFFSGTKKIIDTFHDDVLNALVYIDFYALPVFGKTKIGQLLLYAKQSQNRTIIDEIISIARPKILAYIIEHEIEAIGFISPSIKRKVQFMNILRDKLNIQLPRISIEKAYTDIVRPQKTLSKLSERIENARDTMFISSRESYRNILLIDDAVGSGATLHEVAKKIKHLSIAKNVHGLSITGSAKGFDIISEV